MADTYKRVYKGTISPVRLKVMSDNDIKAVFTKEEWGQMLELMTAMLKEAKDSPALGYKIMQQIVKVYAEPRLGQGAHRVLPILEREVRGK